MHKSAQVTKQKEKPEDEAHSKDIISQTVD